MKRCAMIMVCALMLAGSGCCLCPFSNPCGPYGYGAGYAPFGGALTPQYNQGCPGGACGTTVPGAYPGGVYQPGAYSGGAPVAANPYGYPVTTSINPMPIY